MHLQDLTSFGHYVHFQRVFRDTINMLHALMAQPYSKQWPGCAIYMTTIPYYELALLAYNKGIFSLRHWLFN